jgi:hypothetical protein
MSPHVEAADYHWHGSYNPVGANVSVSYSDDFTFRIEVDGETGDAELTIHGSMIFSGNQPCIPGKPC